jgi:peroxiredoxin
MPDRYPRWMPAVLLVAGGYNLLWSAWMTLFPELSFGLSGLQAAGKPLDYPQLWQGVGGLVGVFGVGYVIAAINPVRHWAVVFVGLLSKLGAGVGTTIAVLAGTTSPSALLFTLFNDVIWWVPFFLIVRRAYQVHFREEEFSAPDPLPVALENARDAFGVSLAELSRRSPVLVVFLRHFGCTYCREAVADIAKDRAKLEADGTRVVFVHLGAPADAEAFFAGYGLQSVARIADPEAKLYRAFGLRRAGLGTLFGWKSLTRFFSAGILAGHGVGRVVGDGTRMGGTFLLRHGTIVREFRTVSPADRPDYRAFATVSA